MGRRGATQTLGSPTLVGRPSQKGAGGRGRMLNPAMSPRRLPAVVPPRPRGRLEPAGAGTPWPAHPHALGPPLFWGLRPQEKHPGAGERRGGQGTEGTRWPPPPSGVGARGATPGVPRLAACHGAWGHSVMGGGGGLGDTVPLGTPGWGAWGHCAMGGYHTPSAPFPVLPILSAPSPRFQYPQSPFPVLPILNTPSPHSQCSLFPVLPVPTPSAPTRTHMEAIRGLIFAPL